METTTWTLGLLGRTFSAGELAKAKSRWNDFARVMGRFHNQYDIYMTPTMAVPPPQIGETSPKPVEMIAMKIIN